MTKYKTYREACEAYTRAFRIYDPIRRAYHHGEIGDKEFIAACKAFKKVNEAYDEAFAVEAGWKRGVK